MIAGGLFYCRRRPAHHHVDPAAAALAAHQPVAPILHRGLSTVSLRHLCRIGFNLMSAIPTRWLLRSVFVSLDDLALVDLLASSGIMRSKRDPGGAGALVSIKAGIIGKEP